MKMLDEYKKAWLFLIRSAHSEMTLLQPKIAQEAFALFTSTWNSATELLSCWWFLRFLTTSSTKFSRLMLSPPAAGPSLPSR